MNSFALRAGLRTSSEALKFGGRAKHFRTAAAFLLRALSSQDLAKLTSIREQLVCKRKRVEDKTIFLVYDNHGRVRAARYCEKNPKGSGFLIGMCSPLKRSAIAADQPESDKRTLEKYAAIGWLPTKPHDVVPNLSIAEEWATRNAISNVIKSIFPED